MRIRGIEHPTLASHEGTQPFHQNTALEVHCILGIRNKRQMQNTLRRTAATTSFVRYFVGALYRWRIGKRG